MDHWQTHERMNQEQKGKKISEKKDLCQLVSWKNTSFFHLPKYHLLIATVTSSSCNRFVSNSYLRPCRKFGIRPWSSSENFFAAWGVQHGYAIQSLWWASLMMHRASPVLLYLFSWMGCEEGSGGRMPRFQPWPACVAGRGAREELWYERAQNCEKRQVTDEVMMCADWLLLCV